MSSARTGKALLRAAFTKAWRLSGRPVLRVVPPVSAWSLPAGFRYDERQDGFVDEGGFSMPMPDWNTQVTQPIAYLPRRGQKRFSLDVMGVTVTHSTGGRVLWDEETENRLRAAWGVALSGRLYRITRLTVKPEGSPQPHEIDLELGEA